MRIAVLGYIVRGPIGGLAWHHLQYVLGLARLGHDVLFVEDSDDFPGCYDPSRHVVDADPSYGLRFAADAFALIGMADRWGYYDAHTSTWLGPASNWAEEFSRSADVILNVSGVNPLRDWSAGSPIRAFVDTDPAFTQARHLNDAAARERAEQHNAFFTFAENVTSGTATIPRDGFNWLATRQPVVLDLWDVVETPPSAPYTTVMQWQSYPPVEVDGQMYGTKAQSFGDFISLPQLTPLSLEIALGGNGAPRDRLEDEGWHLANPLEVALKPGDYQNYVRSSRGELTVAKHGYVVTNSGWFSERSAGYLASGRPVVTQETGFSEALPTGVGLFPFRDAREAILALEEIEKDFARHSIAARGIAEEYFNSGAVLSRLLSEIAG
jgi:hypothetical protein